MILKQRIKTDLSKISLEKRNSIQISSKKIFLCGGSIKSYSRSYRKKLYKKLEESNKDQKKKYVIADLFDDWNKDNLYKDLLIFEQHIAELSSAVVVILESEGAIAELGSFVMSKEFRKKMLVFVKAEYRTHKSFIQEGILKHLKRDVNENSVCFIDDDSQKINTISNKIKEFLKNTKKTKKFKNKNIAHIAFFIYEMIRLYRVLTYEEIIECLKNLKLTQAKKKIDKSIFLLKKFQLIVQKNEVFFCITPENTESSIIEFTNFKSENKWFDIKEFYESNEEEKERLELIKKMY